MPTPTFAIGDHVQFVSPFVDNLVYVITGIQYLTPENEFTDEVTDNFQYRVATNEIGANEMYLEPAT